MPLAHHNGQSIFFAHVPKTGGTSVEDYLIQRFGALSLIDINKREGIGKTGLITPATHLAAVDLKELLPPDLAYSFAVVRDPTDRLMSEYRYQTNVSRMSRMSFSGWLHTVLKAVRQEPRLYENHIRPQVDLIPEGAEIFRLEDGFDALIAKLDAVTGSATPDLTVPHMNTRKKEPISLTKPDVALISEFYANDYDRLGYPYPDETDLPDSGLGPVQNLKSTVLARALVMKQRLDWVR